MICSFLQRSGPVARRMWFLTPSFPLRAEWRGCKMPFVEKAARPGSMQGCILACFVRVSEAKFFSWCQVGSGSQPPAIAGTKVKAAPPSEPTMLVKISPLSPLHCRSTFPDRNNGKLIRYCLVLGCMRMILQRHLVVVLTLP